MSDLINAHDVRIGTVPGAEWGYKRNLRVTVDVRLHRDEADHERETTDHRKVKHPVRFTIVWGIWRPDLRDLIMSTPGDMTDLGEFLNLDDPRQKALADLAPFHLNDMKAGCVHQADADHHDVCPESGYGYGRSWLVEELPEGFEQRVRDALAPYWTEGT